MDEILNKIEKLRKAYPETEENLEVLAGYEKSAKLAVITADLQKHDAIKIIVEQYKEELALINRTLQEDKTILQSEEGRHLGLLLHERRKWCKRFLTIFTNAETVVSNINKTLDNKLRDE